MAGNIINIKNPTVDIANPLTHVGTSGSGSQPNIGTIFSHNHPREYGTAHILKTPKTIAVILHNIINPFV